MEHDDRPKPAAAAETIRRGLIWASVLLGLAIVLKDVIEATDFIYVMIVILVASMAEQISLSSSTVSSKRYGIVPAALILAGAIAVKIVMEW